MATKRAEEFNSEVQPLEAEFDDEKLTIPVIEEKAFLDKKVIETGKVRISKRISEHEEVIDEPFFREEVSVERVPINQYVNEKPAVRYEGDTMIIPVVQEQIVMQKRLVLVEELRVNKQIVETHLPQKVTLLKEEVEITRTAADENQGG